MQLNLEKGRKCFTILVPILNLKMQLLKIAQNVPDSWYTVCGWSVDPQGHLVGTAPSLSDREVIILKIKLI